MHPSGIASVLLAVGALNCTFDARTSATGGDASISVSPNVDADPDQPDGNPAESADAALPCSAFVSAHFSACLLGTPSSALDLSTTGTYLYNTDEGTLADPQGLFIEHQSEVLDIGGVTTRVVSIDSVSVAAEAILRGRGSLPLVVASWSSIEILGSLEFESRLGAPPGAGANPLACSGSGVGDGENDSSGGSGGGGGGFGGQGGGGGEGDGDNTPVPGGAGGVGLVDPPTMVRGGCAGGVGGDGLTSAAAASSGGGAIQLSAKINITISGTISAGGAGGRGGPEDSRAGGGGGGSGGYIGLQAPTIALTSSAVLTANGGGGGEGTSSARTGDSGDDANRNANPAAGGSGATEFGVDGGQGGAGMTLNGTTVTGSLESGGGGGGGSVGFILLQTSNLVADSPLVSPTAIAL